MPKTMPTIGLQKSIADNVSELTDYIAGMKNWENSMKEKEEQFLKEHNKMKDQMASSGLRNTCDDQTKLADDLKLQGNMAYQNEDYLMALQKYDEGIAIQPSNILYANKAMVYLKMEKYDLVEENCTKSISLDPNYVKAYLRRATARTKLKQIQLAMEDYKTILKLEPTNKAAKNELLKLEKIQKHVINTPMTKKTVQFQDQPQYNELKYGNQKTDKLPSDCLRLKLNAKLKSSQEPLKHTKVTYVNTKKDAELFFNSTVAPEIQDTPALKVRQATDTFQVTLPTRLPRTTAQFRQDWRKVSEDLDKARTYILGIPPNFFQRIEIESDILLDLIKLFKSMETHVCLPYMESLSNARCFDISLAFFSPIEMKDFEELVQKLETHPDSTILTSKLKKLVR